MTHVFVTEPPPGMDIPMTAPPTYEQTPGAMGGVRESSTDHTSGGYCNIYDDVSDAPPAKHDRSSMSPASQQPKPKSTEKTRISADNNDYFQPTSHLSSVI